MLIIYDWLLVCEANSYNQLVIAQNRNLILMLLYLLSVGGNLKVHCRKYLKEHQDVCWFDCGVESTHSIPVNDFKICVAYISK